MTKDDKHLRDTILAELRRRRDQDADRASNNARDDGNAARTERTGSTGEPRIASRSGPS